MVFEEGCPAYPGRRFPETNLNTDYLSQSIKESRMGMLMIEGYQQLHRSCCLSSALSGQALQLFACVSCSVVLAVPFMSTRKYDENYHEPRTEVYLLPRNSDARPSGFHADTVWSQNPETQKDLCVVFRICLRSGKALEVQTLFRHHSSAFISDMVLC